MLESSAIRAGITGVVSTGKLKGGQDIRYDQRVMHPQARVTPDTARTDAENGQTGLQGEYFVYQKLKPILGIDFYHTNWTSQP